MILITGAGGKTGRAVVAALAAKGEAVRALVRRETSADTVRRAGAREAVIGQMDHIDALTPAMQGVRAIYHICPNVSPHEFAYGEAVVRAARQAGVQRLVYHSVLRPHIAAMPHHWKKARVEQMLFASGLAFTVLQPAAYCRTSSLHGRLSSARACSACPIRSQRGLAWSISKTSRKPPPSC